MGQLDRQPVVFGNCDRIDASERSAHFEAAEGGAAAGVDPERVEAGCAGVVECSPHLIDKFGLLAQGHFGKAALGLRVVAPRHFGEDLGSQ